MVTDRVGISARVVTDSIHDDSRLTTFEATFPRFILAEFNTHRVLSRNSASSRAIPVWKRLAEVVTHPFVPLRFGKNKAGMQSAEEIGGDDIAAARDSWLVGRDISVIQAFALAGGEDQVMKDAKGHEGAAAVCKWIDQMRGVYPDVFRLMKVPATAVHKQHANRVLEPYAWHTVIVTGTRWRNYYALRASAMAQPEIQELAILMAQAHNASAPKELAHGEWHLPYIFDEDRQEVSASWDLARVSSGRCARVSYLTHDGKRSLDADLKLSGDLQSHGHASPFEHPAMATDKGNRDFGGNFGPKWEQFRKLLPNEHDFSELVTRDSLLEGLKGDERLVDFVLSLPE